MAHPAWRYHNYTVSQQWDRFAAGSGAIGARNYWVEDPCIIDWIGRPLCNLCFDLHIEHDGGPYEPTAAQGTEGRRGRFFPTLPRVANASIAVFLHPRLEP